MGGRYREKICSMWLNVGDGSLAEGNEQSGLREASRSSSDKYRDLACFFPSPRSSKHILSRPYGAHITSSPIWLTECYPHAGFSFIFT